MYVRQAFFCTILSFLLMSLPSSAQELESIEMYFPVASIVEQEGAEAIVTIAVGSNRGIVDGDKGEVWSINNSSYEDRGGFLIGYAEVIQREEHLTTLSVKMTDEEAASTGVFPGDLVAIPVSLPATEYRSLVFDLLRYSIAFVGSDKEPLYSFDDVITNDSPEYERAILDTMLLLIHQTAQEVLPYADSDSTFTKPLTGGRFEGVGMLEAMARSTREDVRAFLQFVRSYPGSYMGFKWSVAETYATWVLSNTPIAEEDLRNLLLNTNSDEEVERLLIQHVDDIANGSYFYDWIGLAEEWGFDGYVEEGQRLNTIVAIGADVFDDTELLGWVYFVFGRISEANLEYEEAVTNYRTSQGLFNDITSERGSLVCSE